MSVAEGASVHFQLILVVEPGRVTGVADYERVAVEVHPSLAAPVNLNIYITEATSNFYYSVSLNKSVPNMYL